MKRMAIWSLEIALVLGCEVGTAFAWGPPPVAATQPPPMSSLADPPGGSMDKPADKPTAPPKKPASPAALAAEPTPEKKPAPTNQVDQAASLRDQELQTLLRRQKVCLQLMQIAEETNDTELLRKAEQLDERAREVYTQRTASLPMARPGVFESDQQTLEKHLGPTNTAVRRPAPQNAEEVQP
jgi:hypothetical protein